VVYQVDLAPIKTIIQDGITMGNNTQMSNKELAAKVAELEAKNAELEKALVSKPVKQSALKVSADETTLKARAITKLVKLNIDKETTKSLIGFNAETNRNEGCGRSVGFYSNRNDKCGDDKASQDRYWMAKSIDQSGFYLHPTEGIVYCSINIAKAGMRTIYQIDRKAKEEVKAYLASKNA
jgi:hypothetical protein